MPANDTGGANEYLLGTAAKRLCCHSGHGPGVIEAALARTRIGVSRTDDDASRFGGWQAFLTNAHGSCADAIAREHAGSRGRHVTDKQREIASPWIGTNATV
jgi:hypothetical protein